MKRILAAGATVLALPLFTACSLMAHADEADALRNALADLPGVARVELDYTEPATLDSGKLELRVDMSADADPRDVVLVTARAYEGFAGAHHGEESDLFVTAGDDVIHLRSFDPDASAAAVKQAAERAVAVLSDGVVQADITTQDVEESPHVVTEFTVTIAHQDGESILRTVNDLERKHADIPHAGWRVQTDETAAPWELGSTVGFPSARQRALYDDLRRDVPRGASVVLIDDLASMHIPTAATPDTISATVGRHLAAMGGAEKGSYEVTVGDALVMTTGDGECAFTTDPVGDRLKQDYGAGCTKVSRAGR